MGLCGAAGACHFLPPWADGHLSWGEGKGWETELFQGSLEEGFHNYMVGSELVMGDWFVLLSCIAAIVV